MPDQFLPVRPNLEQYRKQAKDLLKNVVAAVPVAVTRIRTHHPRLQDLPAADIQRMPFKLADAQLVIAREHGFASWQKFSKQVLLGSTAQQSPASIATRSTKTTVMLIPVAGVELQAEACGLEGAKGLVLLAHARGSSRYHPANRYIADALNHEGFGTISADLLTEDEEITGNELDFDMGLLGTRVAAITDWLREQLQLQSLALGYWGSSNGAAAALRAASQRTHVVKAVVASGGRPDLAGACLWTMQGPPTLFVVGGADSFVLGFIRSTLMPFSHPTTYTLRVIEGAPHKLEAQPLREKAAELAGAWFRQHLLA